MKQYTDYRREQGEQILVKTDDLARLNKDLNEERKVKEILIAQNRKAKNELFKEIQSQKELLASIRKMKVNMPLALKRKKRKRRRSISK